MQIKKSHFKGNKTMKKHIDFGAINAIVKLLTVGKKNKESLMRLLVNNYNNFEVDKALQAAINIKVIRKSGMIKNTSHYKQEYELIKRAI